MISGEWMSMPQRRADIKGKRKLMGFFHRKKDYPENRPKIHYHLPAFEGFGDKAIIELFNLARIKKYAPKEVILTEGEIGQTFYIILEGLVAIIRAIDGSPQTVATLTPGEWLGEIAFARKIPRIATAIALESVVLLEIDQVTFQSLSPTLQNHLYKTLFELAQTRLNGIMHQYSDQVNRADKLTQYIANLRAKNDTITSSGLIQSIIAKIPKLPRYVCDLSQKIQDERLSAKEIAEAIQADPSLTALVLKTVNSSYYGLPQRVADFYHAFLLLGIHEIYNLLMLHGLQSTMPNTPEFQALLLHSNLVAILANEISRMSKLVNKSNMNATVGLLHDIGQSVVLLLVRQNPEFKALLEIVDSAKLGATLLYSWGLPDSLCRVVEYQAQPEFVPVDALPADIRRELAVFHIAHDCCQALFQPSAASLEPVFIDHYLDFLKLPAKNRQRFYQEDVLPLLAKNRRAYPQEIKNILASMGLNEEGASPAVMSLKAPSEGHQGE
jgi:CRP-like cAMP-binding protein